MSQTTVKWGQLERFVLGHGYRIRPSGGDKIILAPKDGKLRTRNQVRIGHKCCNKPGDELYDCYLSALHRAFGITRKGILKG